MDWTQKLLDAGLPVLSTSLDAEDGKVNATFERALMPAELKTFTGLTIAYNLGSWDAVKMERNRLLQQCDWTQMTDAVLTFTQRQAWQDYRQALRDIPQTFTNPDDVTFPEVPTYG